MQQPHARLNPIWVIALTTLAGAAPALANGNDLSVHPRSLSRPEAVELYVPPPDSQSPRVCTEFIGENIERTIARSPNQWGILVESLEGKRVFYSHNADRYFIPASNAKLFTTAAALQAMGPEAPIRNKSLRDWVNVTNQRSNNAYADTLFKFIGGFPGVRSLLTRIGIDPDSYRLADGSGLSRYNAATPRALVDTLRAMYLSPYRETFHASLPVAGVSGTLKNRMRGSVAAGTVYAKTGTLWGVRALSGYLDHPEEGVMVFSILANDRRVSGQALVRTIDAIILQLTGSRSCGSS